MSSRGKKSPCTIAGHTLTWAELWTLNALKDARSARRFDADRAVPIREIFPGCNITSNAKRHTARRLAELGVLAAVGIELQDGMLKSVAEKRTHTSSDLL